MAIFRLCFFACSILRVSNVCNAAVFSDAVNLENSLKNISRTIKPRLNQSDQVIIVAFPVKKYLTKDALISTSLSKDRIVVLLIIFLIEALGIHVLRMGIC
jgi:hypothetical protein